MSSQFAVAWLNLRASYINLDAATPGRPATPTKQLEISKKKMPDLLRQSSQFTYISSGPRQRVGRALFHIWIASIKLAQV